MCKDCKKPYYISTAIAYTSGKPHIGNTYEIVLADAIARYKRNRDTTYISRREPMSTAQKIELKAKDAGGDAQGICGSGCRRDPPDLGSDGYVLRQVYPDHRFLP